MNFCERFLIVVTKRILFNHLNEFTVREDDKFVCRRFNPLNKSKEMNSDAAVLDTPTPILPMSYSMDSVRTRAYEWKNFYSKSTY